VKDSGNKEILKAPLKFVHRLQKNEKKIKKRKNENITEKRNGGISA